MSNLRKAETPVLVLAPLLPNPAASSSSFSQELKRLFCSCSSLGRKASWPHLGLFSFLDAVLESLSSRPDYPFRISWTWALPTWERWLVGALESELISHWFYGEDAGPAVLQCLPTAVPHAKRGRCILQLTGFAFPVVGHA